MKIYLVGGAVRDKLMGIKPKDLDYVMVLENIKEMSVEEGYNVMKTYMEEEGFTIWLETPNMYTIRAKFPPHYKQKGDADFVLARKEVGYVENTRKPILELGTLEDDLMRRDATVNAMAEDEDGNVIDFFGGQEDLKNKILRTPIAPETTFLDDPLRVLRFLRFAITKGFTISRESAIAMEDKSVLDKLKLVVSQERIREELEKMFKHDTLATMRLLTHYHDFITKGILDICFGGDMWLKPTTKQ